MRIAIIELSHIFLDITSISLVVKHCEQLEKGIPLILCTLEKILPAIFFYSMEHLPIYLAFEARQRGLPRYKWMYPFKKFIQYLKIMYQIRCIVRVCEA